MVWSGWSETRFSTNLVPGKGPTRSDHGPTTRCNRQYVYVIHNRAHPAHRLAIGFGIILHFGGLHSHLVGHRYCDGVDSPDPGSKCLTAGRARPAWVVPHTGHNVESATTTAPGPGSAKHGRNVLPHDTGRCRIAFRAFLLAPWWDARFRPRFLPNRLVATQSMELLATTPARPRDDSKSSFARCFTRHFVSPRLLSCV